MFEPITPLRVNLFFLSMTICSPHLGWNHRFNRLVNKHHPNVWHFFDCVKVEEVLFRQQTLKMLTGGQKKKERKVLDLQARIAKLGSMFDQNKIELDELLKGLSLLVGAKK